ncbi:endosome/lysosome-associated apoptosis and autophagy regulator family member 2-like [Acipenser ruthenus]|uniref:endosome/lysosome-associated apoptosis and autophagy regulator family member 2-like n=1 Tax=Acipenser ruthenus TaxID=7906 RepID=UPI00155FFBFF|nr:endosome/lysosome-associated apoptosis and autophagy regulator family member 2-like [Acipenser ruthenus]
MEQKQNIKRHSFFPAFYSMPFSARICWALLSSLLLHWVIVEAKDLPQCKETEYYFEYTECDITGSRWRVAIPIKEGSCSGLPDPVKGTECTFSCAVGEFLEMSTQQCTPCAAGTYSLGSGIWFDEWDDLPPGFTNLATYMDNGPGSEETVSCDNSTWVPKGNYLESNRDDCTVSLIYAVHLKKQGSVSFSYQYVDNNVLFEFFIQNDQCQELDTSDQKWIKLTDHGEWETHTVNLKTGTNILYWRTTGILLGSKIVKPVLLKNIHIEGVAYTSECFPCKPGTYSKMPGSKSCEVCPRNTFSGKGASSCTQCNDNLVYAEEGSAGCTERPVCTVKDYFQIHTPCDKDGKTQIMYKWIEPKICRDDVQNAVKLPPSGEKKACPPCNPGFFNNDMATCTPCPPGTYSDGMTECKTCPAGTEPALGYEFKWWNVLPANMKTSCFNVGNTKCDGMNGWGVAGDHIHSGSGGSDNDYLILNLQVPGFKPPTSLTGASGNEVGRITFVFETICSVDCELYFMMDVNRKSTSVVESWEGTKEKQSYTHIMTKNASVSFTWAFQRTNQVQETRRFVNDIVKIYSITVSNVLGGVASSCDACALGPQQSGSSCVPCPPGNYIDKDSNQCKECPANTYLSVHQLSGKEACIPCGPGSRSNKDHSFCFSDCIFSHTSENQTLSYDFSQLSPVGSIMNGPSFTSRGTKYYHFFNISLCGHEGKRKAVCTDNVTDMAVKDLQNESNEDTNIVETFICQSTIIPSDGRGFRTALSSQSISLADIFIGATTDTTLDGITAKPDLFPDASKKIPDVHFFYRSPQATSSCDPGRTSVISLRCNPEKTYPGELTVPSKCPAGTCDGCAFNFMWESAEACPLCTEMDYHEIEGACRNGIQDTLYVWNEPKLCTKGVSLPERKSSVCEAIDFWLKVGAGIGAFTAVLLISLTCYFWKKNKKLEYKYSRLVMTANKECELPAADSCAIMEGEDNEEDVVYSTKPSLLGKLKSIATKGNGDIFESLQLKSSRSHNI